MFLRLKKLFFFQPFFQRCVDVCLFCVSVVASGILHVFVTDLQQWYFRLNVVITKTIIYFRFHSGKYSDVVFCSQGTSRRKKCWEFPDYLLLITIKYFDSSLLVMKSNNNNNVIVVSLFTIDWHWVACTACLVWYLVVRVHRVPKK